MLQMQNLFPSLTWLSKLLLWGNQFVFAGVGLLWVVSSRVLGAALWLVGSQVLQSQPHGVVRLSYHHLPLSISFLQDQCGWHT